MDTAYYIKTLLVLLTTVNLSSQQITSNPPIGLTKDPYITETSTISPTFLPSPTRVSESPIPVVTTPTPPFSPPTSYSNAWSSSSITTTTSQPQNVVTTTTTTQPQNVVTTTTTTQPQNVVTTTTTTQPQNGVTTINITQPQSGITSKPLNLFNIFIVYSNISKKLDNEITVDQANKIRKSIANVLGIDVESIANSSDIELTYSGEPIRIKRSLAPPNNDATLRFDVLTNKYDSSKVIEDKLYSSPIDLFGLNVNGSEIYVWKDSDNCPSVPCSNGTKCTITQSTNTTNSSIVYSGYKFNCAPITSPVTTKQAGPNLLYLLLLLLLIPIALLIAVGVYSYRNRNPKKNHFVNSYNKERLQAPNYSTHQFDTMTSDKSDIVIMGGEGPPNYETNPRSTVARTHTGTVASVHAFDNDMFNDDLENSPEVKNRSSHVSEPHPIPEGDDSMTFSYMQMRNSKVKDDSMGIF